MQTENTLAEDSPAQVTEMSRFSHIPFLLPEIFTTAASSLADKLSRPRLLPLETTIRILDELEEKLLFLFRTDAKAVTWAYPVTADPTPHEALLDTGEGAHAA
jgi:hypothetical protein